MKGVAAAVVLYYPDNQDLLRNIHSYLPQVEAVYAVDNSPEAPVRAATQQLLNQLEGAVLYYLPNERNEGIAAALNKAAAMALEQGKQWLLTMDQDSYFEEQDIRYYLEEAEKMVAAHAAVAILAPAVQAVPGSSEVYRKVHSVITSGSLLNLQVWKTVGGFDEKLFIDEVDHEYCYRVQEQGYEVIQLIQVRMHHQLGRKKSGGYLGAIARKNRTIHSPQRVYFMVRNYLYVRKKYRHLFPEEFRLRDRQLRVALKNNLLFSGHFLQYLASIFKGYRHYKKGIFDA